MKIENEEIKISSYGLHEMEESATQISIKGEEEMSRELIGEGLELAKTEHSHPLGMVVSTHFRCGKGVKRGLKNGALPFNID